MWRHRAQQRSTPVKREATIAGLASEGQARISGSAGAGISAVVGPTPTDPVEFRRCARDLKTLSAAKKHTNEERGGSRDPGDRRPGAGSGQVPARSLILRAVCLFLSFLGVIFPSEGRLWNFGGTHKIHKRFLTESTGSTWIGKEQRDNVETVHTHLF